MHTEYEIGILFLIAVVDYYLSALYLKDHSLLYKNELPVNGLSLYTPTLPINS